MAAPQRIWRLVSTTLPLSCHGWIFEGPIDGVTAPDASGFRGVVTVNRFTGESRRLDEGRFIEYQHERISLWVLPPDGTSAASLDEIMAYMDGVKHSVYLTRDWVEISDDPINDPD